MKAFIDCEFNGMGGSLLSLAIVTEQGEEWYSEFPLPAKEPWDGWVKDNVKPLLHTPQFLSGDQGGSRQLVVADAQRSLEHWLAQFDTIHVIADWPDDIRHFCDFLITGPGERIDTPPLTMEIRRDIDSSQSSLLHHALHDARAIHDAYKAKTS